MSRTGSPNIDLPEFEGFEIVSQQVQRPMQFSFSFGQQARVESSTIYTFILQPLREGKLTIKPVRVELDGQVRTSSPVNVMVQGGTGAGAMPPSASGDPGQQPSASSAQGSNVVDQAQVDPIAFLRTVVDKPEPYEGEQVTLTIYLYVRERLQAAPSIETEPTTDGLWVHDLLPPSRTLQPSRQRVGDTVYAVYVLRRVAAFPLHAGDVTIGPMAVKLDTTSVFDIFGQGRARPDVQRSSAPVVLHVKPLPAADRPKGEVAVGRYTLTTKLDRAQAATGDAVTLTATVQGQGNIRTVALAPLHIPGADVLAPETKDLVNAENDVVGGTREHRFLIVPKQPGRIQIPALTLATFDPAQGRYETLRSEPLVLEAVGQAVAGTAPAPAPGSEPEAAPDQEPSPDTEADKHQWAEIRTQSALTRDYSRVVDQPWFGWVLALPGLFWLSAVSAGAARRRLAARGDQGPARALREAEQRMAQADAAAAAGDSSRFHALAAAALLGALEARLGEPLSGYTRTQLRERLAERGVPQPTSQELLSALERTEFARFGSLGGAALLAEQATMRALFGRLSAVDPGRAKEPAA